jgi:hypothetical protein
MLLTAAVMLLRKKERLFSLIVMVWMLPAREVTVLAATVELEVSCGVP